MTELVQKLQKFGFQNYQHFNEETRIKIDQALQSISGAFEQLKDDLWNVLDADVPIPPKNAFYSLSDGIHNLLIQASKYHQILMQEQNRVVDNSNQMTESQLSQQKGLQAQILRLQEQLAQSQREVLELEKANLLLKATQPVGGDVTNSKLAENLLGRRLIAMRDELNGEVAQLKSQAAGTRQILSQTGVNLTQAMGQTLEFLENSAVNARTEIVLLQKQLDEAKSEVTRLQKQYEIEKQAWKNEKKQLVSCWDGMLQEFEQKMKKQ